MNEMMYKMTEMSCERMMRSRKVHWCGTQAGDCEQAVGWGAANSEGNYRIGLMFNVHCCWVVFRLGSFHLNILLDHLPFQLVSVPLSSKQLLNRTHSNMVLFVKTKLANTSWNMHLNVSGVASK